MEITNGCIIGAGCKLNGKETLPENSVVYGSNCARRIAMDKPPVSKFIDLCFILSLFFCFYILNLSMLHYIFYQFFQNPNLQIDYLSKILVKFHHLKKPRSAN